MRYTLTPAYGRDYKSRAAVLADLNTGKDFMCWSAASGRDLPLNLEYLWREGVREFSVRFADLCRVAVVKIVDGRAV